MQLQIATGKDIQSIFEIDALCKSIPLRVKKINNAVASSNAYLVIDGGELAGYAIMADSFFQQPFVEMLFIIEKKRRLGIGMAVMQALEEKALSAGIIWSSTNKSNISMQALFDKRGYSYAGIVDLDPGDPELFYRKKLK